MSPSPLRHPARLAGASLLRLQSDERLAELAATGHEAAFDAIVDRYRTPLTRYCAGIVGPSRADDAVQQTMINAHDALKRTDEVRHLRSWLYRIAHNAALNVLRAVRDDVSLDAASGAAAVAEDGPAAAFEASERFRATVAALQELPERQRAALVLRELEGRSHEEIAETLGVTKGSARQHLMRARVALRTAVTAITPYPLIVRLAEALAGPSSAGWTDAAVGAGAGATLAKLTAGVVATGALVGGAVGTERVVHHRHTGQDAAERSSAGSATKARPVKAGAVSLPAAAAGGTGSSAATGSGTGADRSGHARGKDDKNGGHGHSDDHSRGHGGSSGSGSGGRGSDDNGSDGKSGGTGSSGSDDHSGSTSGSSSGHGSGASSDNSGRGSDDSSDSGSSGRSGSKASDDGKSGSGSSGRGSSGSGSGSSGDSGSSGGSDSNASNSGTSTSGRDSSGSDDSSGSGRGPSDDSSGASTPTVTAPTPTVTTPPPPTTTDSGSGSGSSGSDDSGSSGHSGAN